MPGGGFRDVLPEGVVDAPEYLQAMTHRSGGSQHNERLEYLGDAVLELVVSAHLYRRFPQANEGDLSRMRSHLVKREMLASLAKAHHLGGELILGPGELKSGGFTRDTILANAMEAAIGAVYLVKGLEDTEAFIHRLYGSRLSDLPPFEGLKDPKTRLQELLQARRIGLPAYELVETRGKAHDQRFQARCRIPELAVEASAWAASKRKAEQACAQKVLALLQDPDAPPGAKDEGTPGLH